MVEDDFDWIRGNGQTSSWRTGPSKDHTKNDDSGFKLAFTHFFRKLRIR